MPLFDNIGQLAQVAAFQVQDKLKTEALERKEVYRPRTRPGICPRVIAQAFWLARTTYQLDKTLQAFTPESRDQEQDRFKRMLSEVASEVLLRETGKVPPADDIHVMRNILGRIFAYRKNGKFDPKAKTIAIKLGFIKH